MPSFLHRAQEQSVGAWQEEQERKQARTDEEDIGMRQRGQSVPVPGVARRYAEPPATVPETAVACANSRSLGRGTALC